MHQHTQLQNLALFLLFVSDIIGPLSPTCTRVARSPHHLHLSVVGYFCCSAGSWQLGNAHVAHVLTSDAASLNGPIWPPAVAEIRLVPSDHEARIAPRQELRLKPFQLLLGHRIIDTRIIASNPPGYVFEW